MNADCHYGDHQYRGGGACVSCGFRLRCYCGAFVTEAGLDAHLSVCRAMVAPRTPEAERRLQDSRPVRFRSQVKDSST